jgi:thioredoxin reductase
MGWLQARSMDIVWDRVIVGGGSAGLSAALVLGRARRRTLLIDAGQQSNLSATGIGGLLGHDGRRPAELYEMGRREPAAYPSVEPRTGMQYRPQQVPGLAELWGRSVFHCPFCHGWEVRDQPLAVLAHGDKGCHAALLLRGWSDDVVLLTNGPAGLDEADRGRLAAAGVPIDERPVAELLSEGGELAAIAFADGARLRRRGLLVATTLHQRSPLAEQLGADAAPPSGVAADPVGVDPICHTAAPGVFAAGDLSTQMPQVAAAIAAGSLAATAVVQSLLADDYGLVVSTQRAHADA